MNFYVEADGQIGSITQGTFKGAVPLCDGLPINFGDDVPQKVAEFAAQNGDAAQRDCEIVYNYSENGNVLNSVASIKNKVDFTLSNGQAVTVSVWR